VFGLTARRAANSLVVNKFEQRAKWSKMSDGISSPVALSAPPARAGPRLGISGELRLRAARETRAMGMVVPGANRGCQSSEFGNFLGFSSRHKAGPLTPKTGRGTSGAFVASVFSTRGRKCGRAGVPRRSHSVLIAPNPLLSPRLLTGALPVQLWVGG